MLAHPLFVPAACATFLLLAGPTASAQNDVIRCKNGVDVKGRIERETAEGLEVSLRKGVTRRVEWNDVISIDYAGADVLEAARNDAECGRIAEARTALQSLVANEKARRPLRQEARYDLARLEEHFGKPADALAGWRALLLDFPAGRYVAEASSGLVDALLATATPDAAATELDAALAKAKAAGADAAIEPVGAALRGRILEARRDFAHARVEYESAANGAALDPELAARARLGIARCLRGEGRLADATARLREIAKTETQPEVLAGAWNDLADLALDDGVAKRDGDAIRVALYSYLRGVVQYAPADCGRSPEHARALAGAARAFEYEAQLATDPAVKQLAQRRAAELRRLSRAR